MVALARTSPSYLQFPLRAQPQLFTPEEMVVMALGWMEKQHPSSDYSWGIIESACFNAKFRAGEADSSILLLGCSCSRLRQPTIGMAGIGVGMTGGAVRVYMGAENMALCPSVPQAGLLTSHTQVGLVLEVPRGALIAGVLTTL